MAPVPCSSCSDPAAWHDPERSWLAMDGCEALCLACDASGTIRAGDDGETAWLAFQADELEMEVVT